MTDRQLVGDSSLVILFGVMYAQQIDNVSEVVRQAGIYRSLASEGSKGRRLAKHVTVRHDYFTADRKRRTASS